MNVLLASSFVIAFMLGKSWAMGEVLIHELCLFSASSCSDLADNNIRDISAALFRGIDFADM